MSIACRSSLGKLQTNWSDLRAIEDPMPIDVTTLREDLDHHKNDIRDKKDAVEEGKSALTEIDTRCVTFIASLTFLNAFRLVLYTLSWHLILTLFICPFYSCFICSFLCSFVRSYLCSFVRLFVHLFVLPFVYFFVHSLRCSSVCLVFLLSLLLFCNALSFCQMCQMWPLNLHAL